MGWKAFKDYFEVRHLVHIKGDSLCIGSESIDDLVQISLKTGQITLETGEFPGFLIHTYPAILAAAPGDILKLLRQEDRFKNSQPVFVVSDDYSDIRESQCESMGWPNVTHDGLLMKRHRVFSTKEEALASVVSALESARLTLVTYIEKKRAEIAALEQQCESYSKRIEKLQASENKHSIRRVA